MRAAGRHSAHCRHHHARPRDRSLFRTPRNEQRDHRPDRERECSDRDPDGEDPFHKIQAQLIKVLQLPVVQPIANATFGQLMLTATSNPQVKKAFEPDPSNPTYAEQLKAVNLKSSDLKTFADEELDFGGVIAGLQSKYSTTRTPAWVVQGRDDQLVPAGPVQAMAEALPNARYIPLSGGHMQTWVHPTEVARAIQSAAR